MPKLRDFRDEATKAAAAFQIVADAYGTMGKALSELIHLTDALSIDAEGEVPESEVLESETPERTPDQPTPAPNAPTLEAVRAVLVGKSRDGHTAAVRDLLQQYGVDKLSALDPVHYEAVLAAAEGFQ
jgi:hypothetical protein